MNLKQKYFDRKGYKRERTLNTMKANKYLKEGDIVSVADTGYLYNIVSRTTDIPLQNNLFAELKETSFIRWIKQHISKLATQSEAGHISAEDKRKLDNLNNYSHPIGEGFQHIPPGGNVGMALMYSAPGTAKWVNLNDYYYTEDEVNNLLKQYSKTNHNHDSSYYKKVEIDEKLKGKLGVHETAKNSEKLSNAVASRNKDPNSIAQRDSAGDLLARLFRCDYPNEERIEGGIAFRVNENDNYIRFCHDKRAIKAWLEIGIKKVEEKIPFTITTNSPSRTILTLHKNINDYEYLKLTSSRINPNPIFNKEASALVKLKSAGTYEDFFEIKIFDENKILINHNLVFYGDDLTIIGFKYRSV